MEDDLFDFAKFMIVAVIALIVVVSPLVLTIMWFEGHAKSAYLKQVQGVELPWYQATFIETTGNNITIRTNTVEKPKP